MSELLRADALGVVGCHVCGLVSQADGAGHCPRCGARLHRRRPESASRSLAFLLAAAICYIPANLLPVMYTRTLSTAQESTIMAGVIEFWEKGAWDIATIIFVASIAVPSVKFVVLGLLLWTTHRQSQWAQRSRARLYRMVELIGYWSMLDVLVVALMSALVRFGGLSGAEPRVGILYFGLVVIFTMLSAMSFEPRLIWDEDERHRTS